MNDLFPLASMPDTLTPTVDDRAQRIRDLVGTARTCIIEIGRELIAAKADVPHGAWGRWLDAEFGWVDRTAQRYMEVAKAFKYDTMSDLTIDATALYALAAPDVPQEARVEAVARAEDGEHITKAEAEQMIADAEAFLASSLKDAIDQQKAGEAERMRAAIEVANKRHAKDAKALQAEIDRITAQQGEPDVAQAVEIFCKILDKPKLTAKQLRLLAQVLGTPISDGARTYSPEPEADARQAEENLRLSSAADRAIEYFASAPDPKTVRAASMPHQREKADRLVPAALDWLQRYQALTRKAPK